MKLGIIIATDEPETAWNALRLANFSRKEGDEVGVFLLGRGVDYEKTSGGKFDSVGEARKLLAAGGRIMACGTCLKARGSEGDEICPISSMKDLHALIRDCEKTVSF
jgi:uncharacterized protein involved in oxidation of intracellular sulfur